MLLQGLGCIHFSLDQNQQKPDYILPPILLSFSFDIKVADDAPVGTFNMGMSITATVYQEGFGEFPYNDVVEYDFDISLDQAGFPFETADQVFCAPAVVDLDQDGDNAVSYTHLTLPTNREV